MFEKIEKLIQSNNKRNPIIQKFVGVSFFSIGLVGVIVPIVPGFIFLIPGFALLFPSRYRILKKSINSINK